MKLPNPFGGIKRSVSLPSGSLRIMQLVDIAFKNLFHKKLRTGLTVSGVIIGIGSVTFLLSFGFGLRDVVTKQVVDSNSVRTVDVSPAKANLVTLDSENIARINRTPGVVSTAPVYFYAGKIDYANAKTQAVVYGVGQKYIDLTSFNRVAGSMPNFKENSSYDSLYVSTTYAQAIGVKNPNQLVGKKLAVSIDLILPKNSEQQKKTITHDGIVKGIIDNGQGSEIYVNEKVFTEAGVDTANQLKVLAQDKKDVPNIQQKVESLGFVSVSPLQTLEEINQIFRILTIIFLGFGAIGLIIATLGMFNTLTISLLERTKEIGLMVALGARKRDIKRLFIVEAVGLALIGGILGIIGAGIVSMTTNYLLNQMALSRGVANSFQIFSYPAWMIGVLLLFSAVLGLLVVYLPARRAARINPIEALKSS